MANSAENL